MQTDFNQMIRTQREFFNTGKTLPLPFRIEQLCTLKKMIEQHEQEIFQALEKDLHKAPMESFLTEVSLVIEELQQTIQHLKKWSAREKVANAFPFVWPGRSEIHYEPYGVVLIISPWNYPFLLLLSPLIGAIAAGNCVVLKPSEVASATERCLLTLFRQYFPTNYISAVQADAALTEQLLKEKFDYLFFTGGTSVGKIVMKAAAEHLTPLTLELGGKSPCIVDETANLAFAARRIVWAKFLNAGQTCVAPDYLYVSASCKNELVKYMKDAIHRFYGENPEKSSSYGRIINSKQWNRISQLMQAGNKLVGGDVNAEERYISPTLIDGITWQDPIMQQEIFGPLLPILTFEKIDDVIQQVKQQEKPLALYLFTQDKQHEKKIFSQLSFGGGCINDCMLHLANLNLPFGGVGASGMGHYHGKYSFKTFSHAKSIYRKKPLLDVDLQYPPYTATKFTWIRRLLRFF